MSALTRLGGPEGEGFRLFNLLKGKYLLVVPIIVAVWIC
jgi:hypothetical protein